MLSLAIVAFPTPAVASQASAASLPGVVKAADDAVVGETSIEAAQAAAKRTGQPVEVVSLRGESSDVFATSDGNLEAREYLRPVRTRVAGKWQPVDTDLARSDDGDIAPKANTVGLEFSGGGDEPLVRMTRAGRELALSWPGELPAPELDGPTAVYHDVLPDVDLRMQATEDGFTQLLVVKTAAAAENEHLSELRLKMTADGMDVSEAVDGSLVAVDKGARGAVFEAPRPMMWDSSTGTDAAPAPAEEPEVTLNTTSQAADVGPELEQEPAAADSGRLAPVEVDLPTGGKSWC